jgi:hypothetical protein
MTIDESILRRNPDWARRIDAARRATPAHMVTAEPRRPREPAMNGTERAYGRHLNDLKAAGVVTWWAFNAVRLRIAMGEKAAWYKCDFLVEFAEGHFEFHETKGYEHAAGILRLKVAAGMFPVPFKLVKRCGDGWMIEPFNGAAA